MSGGDEVSAMVSARDAAGEARADAFPLYMEYFDRVLGLLHKRGRKGGLWGDMLLKYCEDMPPAKRRRLFTPFLDRAVIYDWHYRGGSPDSTLLWRTTASTPWPVPRRICATLRPCGHFNIETNGNSFAMPQRQTLLAA